MTLARPVIFEIRPLNGWKSNTDIVRTTLQSDANGNATAFVTGLQWGQTYDLYLWPSGFLREKRTMKINAGTNFVHFALERQGRSCFNGQAVTALMAGDVDGNNVINSHDYDALMTFIDTGQAPPAGYHTVMGYATADEVDLNVLYAAMCQLGHIPFAIQIVGDGWIEDTPAQFAVAADSTTAVVSQPGTMSLSPGSATLNVGQNISVGIDFDSAGRLLDGVDVVLTYNPSLLTVVQLPSSTSFASTPTATNDDQIGVLRLTGAATQNQPTAASGRFATVVFHAIHPGIAAVQFDLIPSSQARSGMFEHSTTANVLGQVFSATYTIQGPSFAICDPESGSTIFVGDTINCSIALSPGATMGQWSALFDWTPANSTGTTQSFTAQAVDGGAVIVGGWFDPDGTHQFQNWTYNIQPMPPSPPGAPTITSVVPVDSSTIRVNWTSGSPAGTEVHIESARLYQPWLFVAADAASPFDHTGLQTNTTYCYRAVAHDHVSGLLSAYSNWTCVATPPAGGSPGAPTVTSLVALDSSTIRVNWTFGSPPGTEVHIESAQPFQPWLFLAADAASPFDHTGLQPNTTYCYRAVAHDHVSGLLSAYSNWTCVATLSAGGSPGAPSITSLVPVDSSTIRVNWSFGSPPGTEVHIESAQPYQPWLFLAADAASPFDHTGLQPNTTYCYRAVAHDHVSGLLSAYSNWTCVATLAAGGSPGAPSISVVPVSSSTIRVNWSFGSPPSTEVHIESAQPFQPWLFLAADAASPFDHTGLQPNTTYCYRAIAHDHVSGLLSAYSNWICIATLP